MNKEAVRAMKKKERKFSKWWRANCYKVMRILLFFSWILMQICKKLG